MNRAIAGEINGRKHNPTTSVYNIFDCLDDRVIVLDQYYCTTKLQVQNYTYIIPKTNSE